MGLEHEKNCSPCEECIFACLADENGKAKICQYRPETDGTWQNHGILSALYEISQAAAAGEKLQDTLQAVAEMVNSVMKAGNAIIFLLDERQEKFISATCSDRSIPLEKIKLPPPGEGIISAVVREGKPIAVLETEKDPRTFQENIAILNIKSSLSLPMIVKNKVIGVLSITTSFIHYFTPAEIKLGMVLAGQAAMTIENARLYNQKKLENGRLAALYEIGKVINSTLELEAVLDLIVNTVIRMMGEDKACTIVLLNEEEQSLRIKATTVPEDREEAFAVKIDLWHSVAAMVITRNEPVVVTDYREEAYLSQIYREQDLERWGVVSEAAVPIRVKDKVIGVLYLHTYTLHHFTQEEVEFLQAVADQAGNAIENARLFTETTHQLRKIAEMNHFTDALIEGISGGIVVLDAGRRLVRLNKAGREIMARIGCEDAVIAALEGAGSFDDQAWYRVLVDTLTSGKEVKDVEFDYCTNGKGLITLSMTTCLLENESSLGGRGVLGIITDITERKQLEDQILRAEKLAAAGELAAGIAHEIRNPLTTVKGFMQLMQQSLPEDLRERSYLPTILDELDRMEKVINDFLLFTKPSAPQRVRYPVGRLLNDIWYLTYSQALFRDTELCINCQPSLPEVMVDPEQMKQVFLNLIRNAFEAMPSNGKLEIKAWHDREKDEVCIAFADTGIGMSQETLKKAIMPFFTTKEEGTGLGLPISYRIIQNHQGRIDVESREGEGTVFTVRLPACTGA